jgi:8-oxo-dGTP pyrophosphatase MutT (NUDIX family)/GNAT superfamily N-acetyltransferase
LLTRNQLSPIRARFGYPYHQWTTQEFDELGWRMVENSISQRRAHDVTLLIEGPDGRYAMMSKHSYPPGIYRPPSGGIQPGEDFVSVALREAYEETGLNIVLKRFILHITLDITYEKELITWDSYVMHATTQDTDLKPADWKEGRDTKWATREQVLDLALRLMKSNNGGFIYRGDLTAAFLWAMDNPMSIREANPFDLSRIANVHIDTRTDNIRMEDTLWWIGEIHGLEEGWVGVTAHEDCLELTGLSVNPIYRGKGLSHAMVEYAADQWRNPEKRKKFARKNSSFLNDKLWLITPAPGNYLPVNFSITEKEFLPKTIQNRLTGPRSSWTGMRYQLYRL